MHAISLHELVNAMDGEALLAKMDRRERLAIEAESSPLICVQVSCANEYRNCFGFAHTLRKQVRRELREIIEFGHESVGDLIHRYQSIGLGEE